MAEERIISLVPEGQNHKVVGDRRVVLPGIDLEILTTRMIELSEWELCGLNDPYWRLYLPVRGGAKVSTASSSKEAAEIHLQVGTAYLITPHTTLHTQIEGEFSKWYVHFTLGPNGDRVVPGIFPVHITSHMQRSLESLSTADSAHIPWGALGLVSEALGQLSPEVWSERAVDSRVEAALEFMHRNLSRKLTAEEISEAAGTSVRNMNHLFQTHLGLTPMNALLDFRINEACRMLRHSDHSIDKVAEECGFPNRYYFSRMMKKARAISPAAYRKAG